MKHRVYSTIFLWIAVIAPVCLWGVKASIWLLAIAATLTQYELCFILVKMGFFPVTYVSMALGFCLPLAIWYAPQNVEVGLDFFAFSIVILSISILFEYLRDTQRARLIPTTFAFVYAPFLLSFYAMLVKHYADIGQEKEGLALVLWIIAVAKFTDVGALLTGNAIGRHKLAPNISPKKTWEGAAGGTLAAIAISIGFLAAFGHWLPENFTIGKAIIFAVPVAIMSIISDLIESALKRMSSLKDSGNLIPGIGGIFDLTDSLILSAPLGFLLFKYSIF